MLKKQCVALNLALYNAAKAAIMTAIRPADPMVKADAPLWLTDVAEVPAPDPVAEPVGLRDVLRVPFELEDPPDPPEEDPVPVVVAFDPLPLPVPGPLDGLKAPPDETMPVPAAEPAEVVTEAPVAEEAPPVAVLVEEPLEDELELATVTFEQERS